MMGRRHVRIKALQAFYAWTVNPKDVSAAERELSGSLDRTHELYAFFLHLPSEITDFARELYEIRKRKLLPTDEDLYPKTRFLDNRLIRLISENKKLRRFIEKKGLQTVAGREVIKNIHEQLAAGIEYRKYSGGENTFDADLDMLICLYKKHIEFNEILLSAIEEHCLHWRSDVDLVILYILRNLKKKKNAHSADAWFPDALLTKEDKQFALTLFRKTAENNASYEKRIAENSLNWKADRIAMMDMILMKMALCEILEFPDIPVKVSLNEYIELAKQFSTERSDVFINGILDKIAGKMRQENAIIKTGKGLVEK